MTERICTICEREPITADPVKYPDTDFCRFCWAGGLVEQRRLDKRGLSERLVEAGALRANVWQTGGGCMVLAIRLPDGALFTASHDDGPSIPEAEGPWGGYISETDDAWYAWDESKITEHLGLGDDDGLVAFVREQAIWRNRYRYEQFDETEGYKAGRTSWLIFDRKGVGCMTKMDTEREAALIVAALNAFEQGGAAAAFEPSAWNLHLVV